MIVIILLAAQKSVMGEFTPGPITMVLVRIATTVMAATAAQTFHSELGLNPPADDVSQLNLA